MRVIVVEGKKVCSVSSLAIVRRRTLGGVFPI